MGKRVVTAHVPIELAKKLDGLAAQLDRPRGWLVREALENYLTLAEERRRQTLAALREVDRGRTVPHADVESWARGLGRAARSKRRTRSSG